MTDAEVQAVEAVVRDAFDINGREKDDEPRKETEPD